MTKDDILNTNAISTLRANLPASLDGMGNYKNEFDVQFEVNLDRVPDVAEALRLTLMDIGMSDTDARSFTNKVVNEVGGDSSASPDQSRYDEDYVGRKESPGAYDSYTNTSYNQHQNNPTLHDDSYMGLPVETQMAYAQLTNRVPMGDFTQEMPFEGDPSQDESEHDRMRRYIHDVVSRAKKQLHNHYERITSNDEQMGRHPNTGYVGTSPGSLGWDVTGPSVGGTAGTTNSSSGMSPTFG